MGFVRGQSFVEWWHAPATRRDRVLAFFVGGMGGFWVGLLGRLALGPTPVGLPEIAAWALGVALALACVGLLAPKPLAVVAFPFATFGAGG